MTQQELDKILEDHKLWLQGKGGTKADLSEADLSGANLYGADLTGADLTGANLTEANLVRADLLGANLFYANLSKADLTEINLTGADLTGANLTEADLFYANLTGANLTEVGLLTFQFNQHFAFYHEGLVQIGCYNLSLFEWVVRYEEIGKKEGYTDLEIEMYGHWLKGLLELEAV